MDPASLDLDGYLARIDYDGSLRPTRATLEALHLAHATHIPFENLDALLGRPVRLDADSLQAKLVRGRRGGYCFEQNLLFAAVLERLGFDVTMLAARVRYRATRLLPRTHMLLRVEVDGSPLLADVGFGGEGLLLPVSLSTGAGSVQFAWGYRVAEEASGRWVLQSRAGDRWQDLYAFTEEPQEPVDYEVANYFVSTHPESIFVRTLTVQRPTPDVRFILRGREYVEHRPGAVTARTLADDAELLGVLRETFGLELPSGTRFPAIEALPAGPPPGR